MIDLEKINERFENAELDDLAPSDMADLIAEVERLRSALSQCRTALGQLQEAISGTIGDDNA